MWPHWIKLWPYAKGPKCNHPKAPQCYVIHTFPIMVHLTILFQIHRQLACNKVDTQHKRCVVKCLRKSRHVNEYLKSVYFYLYLRGYRQARSMPSSSFHHLACNNRWGSLDERTSRRNVYTHTAQNQHIL